MSREERRAYERMNKGRDPYAPPVSPQARQRLEREKQRRAAKRGTRGSAVGGSARFVRWAAIGFVVVGLLAFSLAWPQGMPNALFIGLAAGVAWVAAVFVGRVVAGRAANSGRPPRP